MDAKITPLLNPEQQQKYQAVRDRLRRRLIEKAGSALVEKLENEAELKLNLNRLTGATGGGLRGCSRAPPDSRGCAV